MENITLQNGVKMPSVGFGTFTLKNGCKNCVLSALKMGYRLVDTAASYFNERDVGEAIKESGIPREQLFITTKLWIQDEGFDSTLKAFGTSLKNLGLEYLDMYLIHQPFGDCFGSWRAMEKLLKEGCVRAIGVSNFAPERVVDLALNSEIPPMLDQIEVHPYFAQRSVVKEIRSFGCEVQAWGPLCEGQKEIFTDPVLTKIANAHNVTTAQVALKWNLQNGIAVIPRSSQEQHRRENIYLDGFTLTADEMAEIAKLDQGFSEIINYHCTNTAKKLINCKIHD